MCGMKERLFRQKRSARMGTMGQKKIAVIALFIVPYWSRGAAQVEVCSGNLEWLADGFCDPGNNNVACNYDGGDCCECTCTNGLDYTCGSNSFACIDPDCVDPAVAAEFPDCDGNLNFYGDGFCDPENNNAACGYEGGDGCICTYLNCFFNVFDCLDPSAGDELYGCEAPQLPASSCSPDVQQTWVVEDSSQASALAEAVNCSGGAFDIEWRGYMVLDTTINVVHGTALNISGSNSSVINATLHLADMSVSSGSALVGGGIAASASSLTLDGISFFDNTAADIGGALYVTDGSNISFGGETAEFHNNSAKGGGGALYVSGESTILFRTKAVSFSNNKAESDGGAIAVRDGSLVSGSWNARFSNNTSRSGGGALDVYGNGSVSWTGTTTFSNNVAGSSGGATFVRESSIAIWSGETSFYGNNATYGGGVYVSFSSSISLNRTALFFLNRAESGGALRIVEGSSAIWVGRVIFAANIAVNGSFSRGGAVFVSSSSDIKFDGETTFDSNIARGRTYSSGGALFVHEASVTWVGESTFSSNEADHIKGAILGVHVRHIVGGGDRVQP